MLAFFYGESVSEEYRHQCEVRWVLRLRAKDRMASLKYLNKACPRRTMPLRKDCEEQWQLGNRGEKGDWRQKPSITSEYVPESDS